MTRRGLRAPCLAFSLALPPLLPALAAAQATSRFDAGQRGLSFSLGAAMPTGTNDFDRSVRAGFAASFRYLRYPLDWLALGAEIDTFLFRKKTVASPAFFPHPGGLGGTGQASAMSLLAVARLNLLADRHWTPYLLGGAGAHRFFGSLKGGGLTAKPSATGLAVTGAAGIETFVFRDAGVFFEARFHEFRLPRGFAAGSAEALSYMLGVNLWFGLE